MTKVYELDGERIDLDEFITVNEFEADEIVELLALQPGEEYRFGGGAMPITTLRCVDRVCPVFRSITGG